jgi:superfamily II DNA or RNA helicase
MKPRKTAKAGPEAAGEPGLRQRTWPRFLRGPDDELLEKLYVPALAAAVRYDRCCSYFSSSVLAAAARGFAGLIQRLIGLGDKAPRPAVRLVVNEELQAEDVRALIETGDTAKLEAALQKRFKTPRDLLEKQRLAMLGWLAKSGLLAVRVGVMRQGEGIVHAKFGLMLDATGDAVVFSGSGNESAQGLRANYERLEVSTSWEDPERFREYRDEFEALWNDTHPHVHTVSLPEALRRRLIKFAPPEPPLTEPADALERRKAAMLWRFIAEAPYLENGAAACDATAPIDLWPHQRAVIEEAASAWPEGRLLCDEVGLGKTIEAVMVLRRLLAGRGVQRALLLLPAGLMRQWQEELREKGGLLVPRLEGLDKLVWPDGRSQRVADLAQALQQDLLILSRETAKRENHRAVLLAARPWDLVLLDEAHAARRAKQEEGEFNSATLLLELLRQLQVRRKARGFLLLSATPMQTAPWEPWDLLAVLGEGGPWLAEFQDIRAYYTVIHRLQRGDPVGPEARRAAFLIRADKRFPTPPPGFSGFATLEEGERKLRFVPPRQRAAVIRWLRQGSPLTRRMHRNTRQTLREYYRAGLLTAQPPERMVVDLPYDFVPPDGPERRVYEAVASYIDERFQQLEQEKPGKGFVMTIYRRRAASSPQALRRSLERRLEGLRRVIQQCTSSGWLDPREAPENLSDGDLPDDLDPRSIPAGLPTSPAEAQREAEQVQRLLDQLRALGGTDTKRDRLFERIRELVGEDRSVLIFTEYTDTMEYVRDNLANHYGGQVASYNGDGGAFYRDGGWQPASKKEITDALEQGLIRFLVCTDAASEGLNLQAASALINYDLPWNPSKVEQRIGRIDRIGQREKQITIYNFFLKNSIDEQVYGALRRRCGLFERFVGPMQPVLARAGAMLADPKKFSAQELERAATEAEQDFLGAATYLESEPIPVKQPHAVVTRADLIQALKGLRPEWGLSVNSTPENAVVTVKGLGGGCVRFGLSATALDAHPDARPLTVLSPEVGQIADRLTRPGETLPLVIGSYRQGPFRCACAFWVTEHGLEPITSVKQLTRRLEAWDGRLPPPDKITSTQAHAQDQARRQVAHLEARAAQIDQANAAAQRAAAKLRLGRELYRLLCCLDEGAADLEALRDAHAATTGPLAERLRRAKELLGNSAPWIEQLRWEAEQFRRQATTNQKTARLAGSSIDAAFADYRWQAAT